MPGSAFATPRELLDGRSHWIWATAAGHRPGAVADRPELRGPPDGHPGDGPGRPRGCRLSPAVSVVIPCFNLGAYLDEAVQSVLAQTYQDFEILIVDDGSDDPATRHLLASYRRPRTRIISTENRGVASARNTGIEEAEGRYVSFLDADDVLEPEFLARTVGLLENDDSLAFASCWLTAFGEKEFIWEPEVCDFPWLLAEDTVCTASPTRRDALVSVGGFDADERVDGNEDWELAIALVQNGLHGAIVPKRLFRYRIRRESKSTTRERPESHMRAFEYLVDKYADAYQEHSAGRAGGDRPPHRRAGEPAAGRTRRRARRSTNSTGGRPSSTLERHRREVEYRSCRRPRPALPGAAGRGGPGIAAAARAGQQGVGSRPRAADRPLLHREVPGRERALDHR